MSNLVYFRYLVTMPSIRKCNFNKIQVKVLNGDVRK